MNTVELTDFLLARIAEDERRARAAADRIPLIYDDAVLRDKGIGIAQAVFIAHWPPARVLAECKAKRRIVEAYRDERTRRDIYWDVDEADLNDDDRLRRQSTTARTRGLEIAVEALALPYAERADYREEWKP